MAIADTEHELLERLAHAQRSGDTGAAERASEQLLALDPEQPDALAWASMSALQRGAAARARKYAERGLARAPRHALLLFRLACAQTALGEAQAASASFERAYDADPECVIALFLRGADAESAGDRDTMLRNYHAGLQVAQRTGLLAGAGSLPGRLPALLQHALDVVQGEREAALLAALAPLRARHGDDALRRVLLGIDVHLGRAPLEWPHPLQRPTFLLVPGLEPRPWFEREEFPFLDSIERETDAIREELYGVLSDDASLSPYVDMNEKAPAAPVWRDLIRSPRWGAFHFYRYGTRNEDNCRRCPRTIAALDALPIMRIADHSPEAMFSVLRPRTRIPPHTGSINGRLIVHLPLVVPKDCGALRVGGEDRAWHEGRCMVFDDSIVHEAWNDSDETRAVLIFDLWNPQLTAPEREALAAAIVAIGRHDRTYGKDRPFES